MWAILLPREDLIELPSIGFTKVITQSIRVTSPSSNKTRNYKYKPY